MANSLYLSTTEAHCGKSLISLGVLDVISHMTRRIAIFRPVIRDGVDGERNKNIDLLLSHFHLTIPYEETYVFTASEANDLIAHQQEDEFLNRIIEQYQKLEEKYDFILCIGSDLLDDSSAFEFGMNVAVARSLGGAVIIIANAAGDSMDELLRPIHAAVEAFRAKGCPVIGVVANRADPDRVQEIQKTLAVELADDDIEITVIPTDPLLGSPTVKEIADYLGATVLYGEEHLHRLAYDYMVIAMQMQNYLPRLKEGALLITPGDRGEVILSALQAHRSVNYPHLAGVLLTAGEILSPPIARLLDGLPSVLPIIGVPTDTYETVTAVNEVRSYITADNPRKIKASLKLFRKYVNTEAYTTRYDTVEQRGIPPRLFLYNLIQNAKANKKRIVLPESDDERILRATAVLIEQNAVDIILLGEAKTIRRRVAQLGIKLDFDQVEIINPHDSPKLDLYAETLHELRKHKGMTAVYARDQLHDVSYFGTMMVHLGDADGMVSGAAHTTAHTITPAFQFVKTKPGTSVVSSVFFMCLEDRVLVYGDCAVIPKPTAEELAEIAIASAKTARRFGIDPKVAMLSYSSGASGHGEEVERVRAATAIAREQCPDLLLEGPIQYDAAVDEQVGQSKMPGSAVAGRATVLIFPDLNTGNNTYKAVQRETNAIVVGPVLQGLNKPINDLSRGCTVDDVVNTVAITAIQAA